MSLQSLGCSNTRGGGRELWIYSSHCLYPWNHSCNLDLYCSINSTSFQVMSCQVRSGQVRSGQVRSGQVRSGQVIRNSKNSIIELN